LVQIEKIIDFFVGEIEEMDFFVGEIEKIMDFVEVVVVVVVENKNYYCCYYYCLMKIFELFLCIFRQIMTIVAIKLK
jgi:hypothetical protein